MKRLKKILRWGTVSLGGMIAVLFVVWAIMNAVWGAELRKTIAEIKARGEPMTIAEIIPPYVPPEQNAAVELNKAFALMCGDKPDEQYIPFKQGKIKPNLKALDDYFLKKSWKPVSAEETSKAFEIVDSPEFTGIFDALNAAALKPGCNFDLKYEDGISMILPNLGRVRLFTRLQCLKALSLANKGNMTGACDTLMTAVKVSDLLQNEPNLIFQLVRVACLGMILEALNNIADNFQIPEENAKNLIAELEKINTTEPLKKAFISEMVTVEQTIFNAFISGKYKYDVYTVITGNPIRAPCLFYFFTKTFIKKDYCEYLRIWTLYPDACNRPYYLSKESEIKKIETDLQNIPFYCLFSRLLVPNLTQVIKNNAEFQTKLAISKIKMALVIYKARCAAFPENLEQLKPDIFPEIPIDELTGNPLTYKKEGDKYILFSAAVQKLEKERAADRKRAGGK